MPPPPWCEGILERNGSFRRRAGTDVSFEAIGWGEAFDGPMGRSAPTPSMSFLFLSGGGALHAPLAAKRLAGVARPVGDGASQPPALRAIIAG